MNFMQFLGHFRISQSRRMLLEGGAESKINEVMKIKDLMEKTQNVVNVCISNFLIIATGFSLWYLNSEVTKVISSGFIFVSVIPVKIYLESSMIFLLNPLENSYNLLLTLFISSRGGVFGPFPFLVVAGESLTSTNFQ
jgi:uncharacterized protein with PQ loop repeat